jgi:hypothetical protein
LLSMGMCENTSRNVSISGCSLETVAPDAYSRHRGRSGKLGRKVCIGNQTRDSGMIPGASCPLHTVRSAPSTPNVGNRVAKWNPWMPGGKGFKASNPRVDVGAFVPHSMLILIITYKRTYLRDLKPMNQRGLLSISNQNDGLTYMSTFSTTHPPTSSVLLYPEAAARKKLGVFEGGGCRGRSKLKTRSLSLSELRC